MKILALCDSPTRPTGFAEVARNLLGHFVHRGAVVHVWAIGFDGGGYQKFPQFTLIPAPNPAFREMGHAIKLLQEGDYTHVWLLNDLNFFSGTDFPAKLRHVCALKKIRSLIYFPVDARVEPAWCDILARVDGAVTYTRYAEEQVRRAGCRTPLTILPHGVDGGRFNPSQNSKTQKETSSVSEFMSSGSTDRKAILKEIVMRPTPHSERPFATEQDFLLLNVNKNEWRKDPFTSLRILAELKQQGLPAKLILRMEAHSRMGGISLEAAGEQLGLKLDSDWTHLPEMAPEVLPELYRAADLYLTTTLGEGWGLGITEALACGCPVALPYHGVMLEISEHLIALGMGPERIVGLPAEELVLGPIDARLRRRVSAAEAARAIRDYFHRQEWRARPELPAAAQAWLSWPRIAGEMWQRLQK